MSEATRVGWARPLAERIERLERSTDEHHDGPALTVVVRTQGRRELGLVEALTCLAAQTCDDFDVVLAVHDATPAGLEAVRNLVEQFAATFHTRVQVLDVIGGNRGRPLNTALEHARGAYIAFLDDDDVVSTDWVEHFVSAMSAAAGSVVRCMTAVQYIAGTEGELATPYRGAGPLEYPFPHEFDLVRHLYDNQTPICSVAYPSAVFRTGGLSFAEDLDAYEDWDVVLRAALLCGVCDTGAYTSLYHLWTHRASPEEAVTARARLESAEKILARLGDEAVLLPPGSALVLAELGRHDRRYLNFCLELADSRRRLAVDARQASYRWIAGVRGDARYLTRQLGFMVWRRLARLFARARAR